MASTSKSSKPQKAQDNDLLGVEIKCVSRSLNISRKNAKMLTDKQIELIRSELNKNNPWIHAIFEANGSDPNKHDLIRCITDLANRLVAYHDECVRLRAENERLEWVVVEDLSECRDASLRLGKENARLRAEVRRLRSERTQMRMALGGAQAMMVDLYLSESWSVLWDEIARALAREDGAG